MVFFKSGLEAVVWNPEKDCALAEFPKPHFTFETNDPAVIAKLKEMGYQELPPAGAGSGEGGGPEVTTRLKG